MSNDHLYNINNLITELDNEEKQINPLNSNLPHIPNHLENIDLSKLTIRIVTSTSPDDKIQPKNILKDQIINNIADNTRVHLPTLISEITSYIKSSIADNKDTIYNLDLILLTPDLLNTIINHVIYKTP